MKLDQIFVYIGVVLSLLWGLNATRLLMLVSLTRLQLFSKAALPSLAGFCLGFLFVFLKPNHNMKTTTTTKKTNPFGRAACAGSQSSVCHFLVVSEDRLPLV